jgi:diacylglycerol O-acyltransferase / trehalose O-mycolyltransferase
MACPAIRPIRSQSMDGRRFGSAWLAVVVLLAACGGGATASPSSPPASQAPLPGSTPSPTVVVAQPTPTAPTALPTAGPADDGARIVAVSDFDGRTKDLTIESPAVGTVTVRLLLPTTFADQPIRQWPSLYLLHGSSGSYLDWTGETDVEELTASTDLLVVMPDGGDHGWYSDWWNGGLEGPPMWETFHTEELPQLLERNWHASEERAVAGLSMGGYGAITYAARHPGMFVAAASYSGVLDPIGGEMEANDWWGDPIVQTDIWQAEDPVNIARGLTGTVVYVSYGDGTPGPFDNGFVSPNDPESWLSGQNATFVQTLADLGIPATVDAYGAGSHRWPYWERALHGSLPLILAALEG